MESEKQNTLYAKWQVENSPKQIKKKKGARAPTKTMQF